MKQNIHLIILCVVLILTAGCTKPDRSEEVTALSIELEDLAISDIDKALERVDSAEKAIAAEEGHAISTSADSSDYCTSRWILADNAYDACL